MIHITDLNKDIVGYKVAHNKDIGNSDITKRALFALQKKIFSFLSDDEKRLIKLAYVDCLGTEKISNHLHCSTQAVRNRLKKLDTDIDGIISIVLSDNKDVLSEDEVVIYEYYNCYRYTLNAIAELLNVSRKYVSNKINVINLKIKALEMQS